MKLSPVHINRSQLKKLNPVLISKANSFSQADIYIIKYEKKSLILKDFSLRPLISKVTIGRYVLNREVRALQLLDEVPNIPSFVAMVDKYAFLMEMVHGNRLPRKNAQPPSIKSLTTLQSLITTLHNYGITHNDIRRTNIILSHNDVPHLIDFATTFFLFSRRGKTTTLRITIFNRFAHIDTIKALKLKRYYYPHSLTPDEERLLNKYSSLMKIAEIWRKSIYRPLLKQARWKERIERLRKGFSKTKK